MATSSRRLQGRAVFSGADFWELHRRLGECYEADMKKMSSMSGRSPSARPKSGPTNVRELKSVGVHSPATDVDGFGASSSMGLPLRAGPSVVHDSDAAPPERLLGCVPLPTDELPKMETEEKQLQPDASEAGRSCPLSLGSGDMSGPLPRYVAVPHSCWLQKSASTATRRRSISKGEAVALSKTQASLPSTRVCRLPVLNPMGHFRNVWDFVGIILLSFDIVLLPVQFVLDDFFLMFPSLKVKSQVAVFYWFIDILLSFFTGYLYKGTLIDEHFLIAKRYLSSWFVPDVSVTGIDLVLLFMGEQSSTASSAGTRVLRLLRLCRVVRLGKLTRAAAFLRDRFESEVAYTQFTLVIAMLTMLLLEHVIACGWFGLGSMASESNTWITTSKHQGDSFALLYSASLRWALSQLGIGGTQIEAVNVKEGIYTAVVALISLLTFSTVISFMTSLIGTLQHKRMEETHQFGLLRRFLRTNQIPQDLRQRVTRFLQHAYSQRGANSEEPYILDLLSESLHAELQLARYYDYLATLPFFAKLFRNKFLSLQEEQTIASKAMTILETAEDDVIFCHGNPAAATYFALNDSAMLYLQPNAPAVKPRNGEWVSEMCLWTEWFHMGDLITSSFSKFIVIKAEEFCEIVSKSAPCQVQAHRYALEYIEALNDASEGSDLWNRPKEISTPQETYDLDHIFGGWAKVLPSG